MNVLLLMAKSTARAVMPCCVSSTCVTACSVKALMRHSISNLSLTLSCGVRAARHADFTRRRDASLASLSDMKAAEDRRWLLDRNIL